jgi:hypothetical protein
MTTAALIGEKLYDRTGTAVGKVEDVLTNPATLEPEWVKVRFGFPRHHTLVPVGDVHVHAGLVSCECMRDEVTHAPQYSGVAYPDRTTRERLLAHYGIGDPRRGHAAS